MLIITLNGKGLSAACASYAGRVMQSLRLSFMCSLFPNVKSGALLYGHCRETQVGSAVFHCGAAAADHLWESVLLQLSEWHWGVPRADLEENWWGSKECTF